MNTIHPRIIRIGAALSLLVALLAFVARSVQGQTPPVQRLSLAEAARLAASQTAAVQSAQYRVQEAQGRVTQSRSALLPQVGLIPSWSSRTVNSASFGFNFPAEAGRPPLLDPNGQSIGPVKLYDFRGEASQSLFDAGALGRVRAARANVTAASADVATAAEGAAVNAAAIYVRSLRADATLQARIADSALANDLLQIARDQLEAGVGVALDVTRAQSRLAATRSDIIVARNDRDRSRLELLRALNLALDTPLQLSDSLGASLSLPNAGAEQEAVDLAIRTRPDIRAADAQLAAAEQQAAAIRATRLPTVGVFGNDGPNGLAFDHLLNTYTYGVQVSWPVFEGKRREGQLQEQQAVTRDIDVRRRDLRQQIAADVRAAMLDIASAREQMVAARERQRLAELEVEQARERFRAGVAGNADVITALVTLNAARTGMIDALTGYQTARLSLARAEGTVSQLR